MAKCILLFKCKSFFGNISNISNFFLVIFQNHVLLHILDKVRLKGKFYFCYEFLNLKNLMNYFILSKRPPKTFN
jgi:hypothetical protein